MAIDIEIYTRTFVLGGIIVRLIEVHVRRIDKTYIGLIEGIYLRLIERNPPKLSYLHQYL